VWLHVYRDYETKLSQFKRPTRLYNEYLYLYPAGSPAVPGDRLRALRGPGPGLPREGRKRPKIPILG